MSARTEQLIAFCLRIAAYLALGIVVSQIAEAAGIGDLRRYVLCGLTGFGIAGAIAVRPDADR